jgi:hypothetical protein
MIAPPGIARELNAIYHAARELEGALASLRDQLGAYVRDCSGEEAVEQAAAWRATAQQHIRARPVLRNILR